MAVTERGRWLCVDPGEDTGWSVWKGLELLGGGTDKMWPFVRSVYDEVAFEQTGQGAAGPLGQGKQGWLRPGIDGRKNRGPITRIVCEDWRLYPDKLKALAWDQCRTARAIGGLYLVHQVFGLEFILQGANIKTTAVSAGAEELFLTPLHENRHHNDSIMHGVFYRTMELM